MDEYGWCFLALLTSCNEYVFIRIFRFRKYLFYVPLMGGIKKMQVLKLFLKITTTEWQGCRGLVGLFTTHGAKGRGIKSQSFSFFYSFPNQSREEAFVTRRNVSVWKVTSNEERWRNAGAANQRRKTGRRFRNDDDEKGKIRFVSKTIKWLTPIKEWHGEKI